MICVMRLSFYCGHTFLSIFFIWAAFLGLEYGRDDTIERKIKALHVILFFCCG